MTQSAGATSGLRSTALAVLYIFLWASAFVPSKIAAIHSPPLWFLTARFLVAGVVMLAIALASRDTRTWAGAIAIGMLANAGYLGFTYTAMQHHLTSGMGAIVSSLNPLTLALVAPFALREPLTKWKAIGSALGFGGVVALVYVRSSGGSDHPSEVALAFVGVLAGVISTIIFKKMRVPVSALLALNAIQLVVGGLAVAPVAALLEGAPHIVVTTDLIWSFAYLVIVLSVGASLLWFWLLSHGEASRVSAFYYLTPAFGLLLSALLLAEPIHAHDLIGLAVIAVGIALVQRG
jgi:drug/metabolite transporter (DMT)-like permease